MTFPNRNSPGKPNDFFEDKNKAGVMTKICKTLIYRYLFYMRIRVFSGKIKGCLFTNTDNLWIRANPIS